MSVWTNTITNNGMRLLNTSLRGETVKITRAVSGSNSVSVGTLVQQTTIEQVKQNLDLQVSKTGSDGSIEIPVILTNKGLGESYNLGQIGLYAEDKTEGEILFAIAQLSEKKKIPSEAESTGYTVEFLFKFKLSNEAEIHVDSPSSFVTMETVEILVGAHANNKENPHGVTAAQVGAITPAEADALLKGHTDKKDNPHGVTKDQVGLGNVPNVATNDQTPTYTTESTVQKLTSGEKLSVAMGKIAAAVLSLNIHLANKNNPHNVSATQVGLGNVPNVATNDQTPTYTQASNNTALSSGEKLSVAMGKIAKAINSLISHLADTNNPHNVTKSHVGLSNVNNTSDAEKPISTATQAALDLKANSTDVTSLGNTKANATDLTAHTGSKNNPHNVTASQVGLGNVPNVATNDQTPTFTEPNTVISLSSGEKLSVSMGKIAKAINVFIDHLANGNNPHAVTKSQIGLNNVNNTSDAAKPISTATQAALDLKANASDLTSLGNTKANASDLTAHTGNKSNPHGVTKSQVGLGNVPNVATNDQTPTYTAASSNTLLASGEKLSVAMGKIAKAVSSLISHLGDSGNPHGVTKSQVGLGNVNNTSDANKPVSTATQTALDAKLSNTDFNAYKAKHNVETYTSLATLGLAADNFDATTLEANLYLLHTTLPNYGSLTLYGNGSHTLIKSIKDRIASELDLTLSDSYNYGLIYTKYGATNTPAKLELVQDNISVNKIWMTQVDINGTTANVSTFAEVYNPNGFLSKAGGTMTAQDVYFHSGGGRVFWGDKSMQLETLNEPKNHDNKRLIWLKNSNSIRLRDCLLLVDRVNGTESQYDIFGSHNKPAGSYIGNGKLDARTIDTGGLGELCIIQSSTHTVLLGKNGGMYVKRSSTTGGNANTINWLDGYFTAAKIEMETTNEALNKSGETYYYRVF